jgi:antirestriction protein
LHPLSPASEVTKGMGCAQQRKKGNFAMTSIFLQSLADYNAGEIIGKWFDVAKMDETELQEAIAEVLSMSKQPFAEEIEIADYDGFYGLSPCLSEIVKVAQLIDEHGEAYAHYALHVGENYATEEDFLESYSGEWESFLDFATDLFDEIYLHDVPKHIQYYIDYEKFARDLEINDYYTAESEKGMIYVFRRI